MSFGMIVVALIWGTFFGYLLVRLIDNLTAAGLCVDGLLKARWKRLESKASTGQVNSAIVGRLLLRVSLYAFLCAALLQVGHRFVQREFGFEYSGLALLVFAAAALAMGAARIQSVRHRLRIIWRMSHEPDYAEKRRRTQMLKR